eukprot:CAMPEP_0113230364 /NCGR_PEP_ID=MMETSP0008_2-20120614/852_1 /TAXON_ID=97485 /ORGANISM="Prymnesium parvum" /LENGTH=209 /DNA_ID=CAMNT_0000076957 /DNA_START=987 /DNA_END=1616 /DNA_ORIENTATION=+ /assembly_acc=CAM_ASM_000153
MRKRAHTARKLQPQWGDTAKVLVVEDVEATALRLQPELARLEKAAGEGPLSTDQIGVLRRDHSPGPGAEGDWVEWREQQHVCIEQGNVLFRWVDLTKPEHDRCRLVVRRVALLVDECWVAKAHIVMHKSGAYVHPSICRQLVWATCEEPRDGAGLVGCTVRVEERDRLPSERMVAFCAEDSVHAHGSRAERRGRSTRELDTSVVQVGSS